MLSLLRILRFRNLVHAELGCKAPNTTHPDIIVAQAISRSLDHGDSYPDPILIIV